MVAGIMMPTLQRERRWDIQHHAYKESHHEGAKAPMLIDYRGIISY
jgi:hypothetical protein